jgi:hypothetical protein
LRHACRKSVKIGTREYGFETCWLMRNVRLALMYDKQQYSLTEPIIKNKAEKRALNSALLIFIARHNVLQKGLECE